MNRRNPRLAKRGICVAFSNNSFKISVSFFMKSFLPPRFGAFWCLAAFYIGLNAQNGKDLNYKVFSKFSLDFNGD